MGDEVAFYDTNVIARALSFGNYEYLHGLLPQPPHFYRWFIGCYIPTHHGVRIKEGVALTYGYTPVS